MCVYKHLVVLSRQRSRGHAAPLPELRYTCVNTGCPLRRLNRKWFSVEGRNKRRIELVQFTLQRVLQSNHTVLWHLELGSGARVKGSTAFIFFYTWSVAVCRCCTGLTSSVKKKKSNTDLTMT